MEKDHTRLIVIAFGDSLTVGFQSPTFNHPWYQETPYVQFFNEKLYQKAYFILKGINGETTDAMVKRFERDVIKNNPDFVIILGGTNDVGWGIPLEKVIKNLVFMYKNSISAGIIPVGITVPSIRGFDNLISPRLYLNERIKKHCSSLHIPCIDLFTATVEPGSLRLATEYSNDGLHLSTEGYKLLAELLYNEVFYKIV